MFEELDGLVSVFYDGSVHLSIWFVIHNYEAILYLFLYISKTLFLMLDIHFIIHIITVDNYEG